MSAHNLKPIKIMKTKRLFLTTTAMSVALCSMAAQEYRTVPSRVTDATVFFNGAELTHTARAQLSRGENQIVIEGLSPYIDANSLKIKVSDNVVVASSEFSVDYLKSARDVTPLLKELQAKIAAKNEELGKVEVDIRINDNMISLLREGITKNVSGSEKGLGTDELKKTLDYYKSKSEELESEKVALNNRRNTLRAELQTLQNQYNQESVKGNKTSGVLRLNLSSPKDVNASFEVVYYTSNAGWEPYYDINITNTDKPVSIIAKSKVKQTTGLDWEKVKLTLSTSVPNNGKVAPLFNAWFLKPIVMESWISSGNPVDAGKIRIRGISSVASEDAVQNSYSYKESAESQIVLSESTMQDYIVANDNELNVTYAIELPYTIPGNGKEQNIDLMVKETSAEYKYYATPKLDTRTYLIAEIGDWQKLGLLSGVANLTYDGTYVGQTYIDASSTSEKLTLTLGTDARVAVKREKLQDFSSTRTIGSDIQQVFTYRITVKNNQTRPVKLVTKDQYPISTQKNIEVTLRTKETTKWTANVEQLGVVTWEEELAPGESKTYDISYSVKYPKSIKLNL